ncbi:MAG: hypothetical protein ACI81R_003361 [Bradymonadia bacterium]|jgi:hypothetical protein
MTYRRTPALSVTLLICALFYACNSDSVRSAQAQSAQSRSAQSHEDAALPRGAVSVSDMAARAGDFGSYWYQGLAELNRYSLSQSRYGEIHEGEAVLVFVTEDFRTDRHVKFEGGSDDNVASALKLNAYRRFYTGIYPYTILTSTFVPARTNEPAWKVTSTMQEWCGTTFQQFNATASGYDVQLRSYFDGEGDTESQVVGLLEDDLFTRARRDPRSLPTGSANVVPATHVLRMLHLESRAYGATLSVQEVTETPRGAEAALAYEIDYDSLSRTVVVYLSPAFPHQILAWTEQDGGGEGRTTTAMLTGSMLLDYWNRNRPGDAVFRDALGLSF